MFKKCVVSLIAAMSLSVPTIVIADYPEKPVRVIVPFAPGGNIDVSARMLSSFLADELDEAFVVENRSGAGGSIGAQAVAQSKPDGHVLLSGSNGMLAVNPAVNPLLAYDPIESFEPVAFLSQVPLALTVHGELPIQDLTSLKDYAQSRSEPISIGSSGAGGAQHLAIVEFGEHAGIPITHVPYRGGSAVLPDLMGGMIDAALNELPNVLPAHRDGQIRIIAIAAHERSPLLPDVPTLHEAGLDEFYAYSSNGWLAPAGTPDHVIKTLEAALDKALSDEKVRQKMLDMGLVIAEPEQRTSAWYAQRIRDELKQAKSTADRHGIQITQ